MNRDFENDGKKIDPRVKDVLKLLGAGIILSTAVLFPSIAAIGPLVKPIIKEEQRKRQRKEWDKFNLWRLRQVIKRLEAQKVVEVNGEVVKITEKGRKKLLKFDLENMELKERTDGKWRLIVYDVADLRKEQREIFRSILKKLKCFQLQESVYLTPFVCDDEIEYLRNIFGISTEVKVIKVSGLENEIAYRKYFGL